MAFTLSHMAAALPFYCWRKWISFEALLLGTMLPDLPYFLNSSQALSELSHSWYGLLSYCLPWGLGIFALWYLLLKPAAFALVQPWWASTTLAPPHKFQQWMKFSIRVILGLLLGATTHIIWDGITHSDGFIAQHFVWLQLPVNIDSFISMSLARLLQYGSSLMGLGLLGWFFQAKLKKMTRQKSALVHLPIIKLKLWHSLVIILIVCIGSLFCGLQAMLKWHSLIMTNTYLFLARVLLEMLQSAVALFIVYAVIYQVLYWCCHAKSHYLNK